MAMFGRATRNDVLRSYTPTMAERIPIAVQGFLGRLGLNKYQARSFGQPIADVLGYSPVGAVAQSWDAGQTAARAPGMFGKAAGLGGGMALAALGAVPGGKALTRKGEALAMDEASRMARAAEQGFDTERTLYHGTTAAKDFKALKAGKGGIDELGKGIYATTRADHAEAWARDEGGRIMPLHIRKVAKNENGDVTAAGLFDYRALTNSTHFTRPAMMMSIAQRIKKRGADAIRAGDDELMKAAIDAPVEELAQRIDDTHRLQGRDGLNHCLDRAGYIGAKDEYSQIPGQVVVFDPANIRSKFAAFDPAKRGSANLLAGVGAGAMLAPSMFGNRGGER